MPAKRIIPCLDVKEGRTVKGVHFTGLRDAGDPVELGARYAAQGADELVFLDITASIENRPAFARLVEETASVLNIPFTAGGGISSCRHVETLLRSGADKITVNTAAVLNPALISRLAAAFGSQCIVVAVDIRRGESGWEVWTHGGRCPSGRGAVDWAAEAADRGAGEILLTSMDHDGTTNGFAAGITRLIADAVPVPVIASGGAGRISHFIDVFQQGGAEAALAASVFHYGTIGIPELKERLAANGIPVRPVSEERRENEAD
ncbi:imidazole glycerol phosphate synthase subunit HisF [bacterium]|nr:imidazole glycerol phosphate synthase subunit HisF [bacterium]